MIQEYVRAMTADEQVSLQSALRPVPARARQTVLGSIESETWITAGVALVTGLVLAVVGAKSAASAAIAIAAGVALGGVPLARAAIRESRRLKFGERYTAQRDRELAAMLEDRRVTVKRVHAVAVVEIEPMEDEGTGYVFDLGDGRVLFLKGQDYDVADDDAPWPNTDFEIVRAATDGTMLGLHCHGAALRPLRVVPRDDVDPQKGWDEREEVLEMSMDEAMRSVLREP
jgi:hypothetical protein